MRGTKWNSVRSGKSPHSYGVVRDVDQTSETKQSSTDVSNVRSANSNAEFSLDDIPKYTSSPSVVINSNEPYFTKEDI